MNRLLLFTPDTGGAAHDFLRQLTDEGFFVLSADTEESLKSRVAANSASDGFDCLILYLPCGTQGFYPLMEYTSSAAPYLTVIVITSEEELQKAAPFLRDRGIYALSETLASSSFREIFTLLETASARLIRLKSENDELTQKIRETKLIDRAKCVLIQHLKLSEEQAHRYIEKQAMDLRISKEKVARVILNTYES